MTDISGTDAATATGADERVADQGLVRRLLTRPELGSVIGLAENGLR